MKIFKISYSAMIVDNNGNGAGSGNETFFLSSGDGADVGTEFRSSYRSQKLGKGYRIEDFKITSISYVGDLWESPR